MYILEHNLIIDKKTCIKFKFQVALLNWALQFLADVYQKTIEVTATKTLSQETITQDLNSRRIVKNPTYSKKKKELFLILYVLANNPHNVQDTFIYYERQTAGENLNILQLDSTTKKNIYIYIFLKKLARKKLKFKESYIERGWNHYL